MANIKINGVSYSEQDAIKKGLIKVKKQEKTVKKEIEKKLESKKEK